MIDEKLEYYKGIEKDYNLDKLSTKGSRKERQRLSNHGKLRAQNSALFS